MDILSWPTDQLTLAYWNVLRTLNPCNQLPGSLHAALRWCMSLTCSESDSVVPSGLMSAETPLRKDILRCNAR